MPPRAFSPRKSVLLRQGEVRATAAMEADGDCARACLLTMCGLPGAGKSTLARAVAARAESDGIRVSLVSFDDVERRLASEKSGASASRGDDAGDSAPGFDAATWKAARREALATVERLLLSEAEGSAGERAGGENDDRRRALVIADDNFYYAGMRQQCHRVACRARAAYAQLFVSISRDQAHARNASREPSAVVPRDALERMADQFEPPVSPRARDAAGATEAAAATETRLRPAGRAFERDATVTVDAERLGSDVRAPESRGDERPDRARRDGDARLSASDVDAVWLRVREKWTRPAATEGDSREARDARRRAGCAANAASAAHALDVRSRKVLTSAMARAAAEDAFSGMSKQARGALSRALNDARREMVDAVRAAAAAQAMVGVERRRETTSTGARGDEDADADAAAVRDAELGFVAEMHARESRFAALCRAMLAGER